MHTRFVLLVPLALGVAACGDTPTAPQRSGPSPPPLNPLQYALFNDPLTLQLASRLHVSVSWRAGPGQGGGTWAMTPNSASTPSGTASSDSAEAVVESAALQFIIDLATNTPSPESGAAP